MGTGLSIPEHEAAMMPGGHREKKLPRVLSGRCPESVSAPVMTTEVQDSFNSSIKSSFHYKALREKSMLEVPVK